jgi:hypothetical protein
VSEYQRWAARASSPGRFKANALFDGQARTPFFPKDYK